MGFVLFGELQIDGRKLDAMLLRFLFGFHLFDFMSRRGPSLRVMSREAEKFPGRTRFHDSSPARCAYEFLEDSAWPKASCVLRRQKKRTGK